MCLSWQTTDVCSTRDYVQKVRNRTLRYDLHLCRMGETIIHHEESAASICQGHGAHDRELCCGGMVHWLLHIQAIGPCIKAGSSYSWAFDRRSSRRTTGQ